MPIKIENLSSTQQEALKAAAQSPVHRERLIPKSPEEEKQISLAEIQEKYKKILVHALPDGREAKDTGPMASFTTNPPFEVALRRCLSEGLENLCCSSVSEGDDYNRWGGTTFGLYALDGVITDASPGDANSWHKKRGETQQVATTREILRSLRSKGERHIDELQLRTQPTALVPYFDLDMLTTRVWREGFAYLEKNNYNKSPKECLERYTQAVQENKLDEYFLYRGQIGRLDKQKLLAALEPLTHRPEHMTDREYDRYEELVNKFREQLPLLFQPRTRSEIIHERGQKALELLKQKLQKNRPGDAER